MPREAKKPKKKYFPRKQRPKTCMFCSDKSKVIDYKNVDLLKRFVAETGKIVSKRSTGVCASHQRKLSKAIKVARHLALLPYVSK